MCYRRDELDEAIAQSYECCSPLGTTVSKNTYWEHTFYICVGGSCIDNSGPRRRWRGCTWDLGRGLPFGSIKRPDFDLRASWIYGALLKLSGVLRGDNKQVGMAGIPKLELREMFRKGVWFQYRRSEPSKLTRNRFELHIITIVRPLSFDLPPPHCQ